MRDPHQCLVFVLSRYLGYESLHLVGSSLSSCITEKSAKICDSFTVYTSALHLPHKTGCRPQFSVLSSPSAILDPPPVDLKSSPGRLSRKGSRDLQSSLLSNFDKSWSESEFNFGVGTLPSSTLLSNVLFRVESLVDVILAFYTFHVSFLTCAQYVRKLNTNC